MPNLHPLFVHFPITWFLTALGFDVACLIWRSRVWLDRVAVILYFLAALGAAVAIGTGRSALAGFGDLPSEVKSLAAEHSDWAFFAFVSFIVVFLLRFDCAWRDRNAKQVSLHRLRFLALAASLAYVWILYETAERGALLVHHYGISVSRPILK